MNKIEYKFVRQRIEVEGWKAASEIAEHLVRNGYEVLISTDGEDFGGTQELIFSIEFSHMKFDEGHFVYEDHE